VWTRCIRLCGFAPQRSLFGASSGRWMPCHCAARACRAGDAAELTNSGSGSKCWMQRRTWIRSCSIYTVEKLNTRESLCQDSPGRHRGAQQGVSLPVAEWVSLLADLLDGGPRIPLVSLSGLYYPVFSTYCAPPPGFRLDTTNSISTRNPSPSTVPLPSWTGLPETRPVIVEGAHLWLPLPGRDAATLVRRLLLVPETERPRQPKP